MISPTTQEKQYRFELTEFILKNPSADEKFYINYRIKILENVLKEYYETADFAEGEYMDGKELIDGNLITTKTGTASDYLYFSKELDFLKAKFKELTEPKQATTPPTQSIDTYSEIFSNNGFELFEHILNAYVKPKDKKGRKSDLIYFYWEMYNSKTKYIHQRPEAFFNWFDGKYNETSGQLKTYDNVKTDQRKKDYSNALDWFKQQK